MLQVNLLNLSRLSLATSDSDCIIRLYPMFSDMPEPFGKTKPDRNNTAACRDFSSSCDRNVAASSTFLFFQRSLCKLFAKVDKYRKLFGANPI